MSPFKYLLIQIAFAFYISLCLTVYYTKKLHQTVKQYKNSHNKWYLNRVLQYKKHDNTHTQNRNNHKKVEYFIFCCCACGKSTKNKKKKKKKLSDALLGI